MAETLFEKRDFWLKLVGLAALFGLFLLGCSDQFISTTNPHPVDFFQVHAESARADIEDCRTCHGLDLQGVGQAVNCLQCHTEGEPIRIHRLPFTNPADHGPPANANLKSCQGCHAEPRFSGPGSNPRFDVPIGILSVGCESCHRGRTAHPTPLWQGGVTRRHNQAGNKIEACPLCHGANFSGPAEGGVGPACSNCHQTGSPLILINCSSCHNRPPDGGFAAGNIRPNRDGSHLKHNAIAEVSGNCPVCHNGFGSNTPGHFDETPPADVSILPTFDSKTGGAIYDENNQVCGNVSCHGGQDTPNWESGIITISVDCKSCHEGGFAAQSPQFNSYSSGQHLFHILIQNKFCTDCHDASKLAPLHFSNLATPIFEGTPSQTLRDVVNYDGSTCAAGAAGACHGRVQGTW